MAASEIWDGMEGTARSLQELCKKGRCEGRHSPQTIILLARRGLVLKQPAPTAVSISLLSIHTEEGHGSGRIIYYSLYGTPTGILEDKKCASYGGMVFFRGFLYVFFDKLVHGAGA